MSMLYLNVRHTLPMIGMRSQKNTLDAGINQPSYDQTSQQARSNKGKTQPKIDIDSYPSRHGYGYTNHTDFARENEQEGLSGVQQGTSKHTQMAWALAEDGPKPGRMVPIEQVQSEVQSIADQNRVRRFQSPRSASTSARSSARPRSVPFCRSGRSSRAPALSTTAAASRPISSARVTFTAGSARDTTIYWHNRSF